MALINRNTLKNYFKKGGFAKENHFVDLIDSTLNSVDDGIEINKKRWTQTKLLLPFPQN